MPQKGETINQFSSQSPLPAIFKTIKGQSVWQCGVADCCGRLANVVDFLEGGPEPGEPNYDGPLLMLPDDFDRRPDGTYAKTRRSGSVSEVAKTLRARTHFQEQKKRARRRGQHRTWAIDAADLKREGALRVKCPGCGRVGIMRAIISVTGESP
jgi:hypothetical protein